MATVEDFERVIFHLEQKFQFIVKRVHENVAILGGPTAFQTEIVRVVFDEKDAFLGLSFQVEVVPSDAIQIFSEARQALPEVQLLNSYYRDQKGNVFHAHDAVIMAEHEKQQKFAAAAQQAAKAKQADEWEMKQMRKGKITFH